MLRFVTEKDNPDRVEIPGVGLLLPNGAGGGVSVKAAAAVMAELQERNPDGTVRTVHDDELNADVPVQLTGSALTAAAKEWAGRLDGVTTIDLSDAKVEQARSEAGYAADRPPLQQVAEEEGRVIMEQIGEAVNDEPVDTEQIEGNPTAGTLALTNPDDS